MVISLKKVCCVALLLVLMSGFAGCGSHETPVMTENAIRQALLDKTWTLEKVVARELKNDPPLTLKFHADGTVEGFGGCNDFNGQYTLEGDKLTFGPMATTHKSCGPATDEQEFTFLTFLAKIQKLTVEEDELILFTDSQGEMLLTSGEQGLFW